MLGCLEGKKSKRPISKSRPGTVARSRNVRRPQRRDKRCRRQNSKPMEFSFPHRLAGKKKKTVGKGRRRPYRSGSARASRKQQFRNGPTPHPLEERRSSVSDRDRRREGERGGEDVSEGSGKRENLLQSSGKSWRLSRTPNVVNRKQSVIGGIRALGGEGSKMQQSTKKFRIQDR